MSCQVCCLVQAEGLLQSWHLLVERPLLQLSWRLKEAEESVSLNAGCLSNKRCTTKRRMSTRAAHTQQQQQQPKTASQCCKEAEQESMS